MKIEGSDMMLDLYEEKQAVSDMEKKHKIWGIHFDHPRLKADIQTLEKKTEEPEFWNDQQAAQVVLKELSLRS